MCERLHHEESANAELQRAFAAMTGAQLLDYWQRLDLDGEVFLRWTDATQTAIEFVEPAELARP